MLNCCEVHIKCENIDIISEKLTQSRKGIIPFKRSFVNSIYYTTR